MLSAEEQEELRSLQARAYGRDAVLTPTEADRLRELDDRRFAVRAAGSAADGSAGPPETSAEESTLEGSTLEGSTLEGSTVQESTLEGSTVGPGRRTTVIDAPEDGERADAGGTADEGAAEESSTSTAGALRATVRAYWRPLALAAAFVLVVGLGIGWLAFGRSGGSAPVELTAEQQEWQNTLLSGGRYDPGSIRALAVEEGAVVWTATMDENARTCLILGTGDVTMPQCDLTETAVVTGISGSITVDGEGDLQRQLSVQMLFTAAGDAAVAVSSYDYDPSFSGITYANDQESRTAERLADEGFDTNSLWVVGYDGDVPVWTAVKVDAQTQCLIYDGSTAEAPIACADPETMQDQASSLVLNVVDTETGGVTHLELPTSSGPGYLVITREGGVEGAGED